MPHNGQQPVKFASAPGALRSVYAEGHEAGRATTAALPTVSLFVLLLLVLIVYPWIVGERYWVQVGILVLYNALLATAWVISGGYAGLFSVGHAAFVGLGAYASTLLFLRAGVPPWLGMMAGFLLAAVVALAVGYPCFRMGVRGDYFALVTLAFGEIAFEVANGLPRLTGGPLGLSLPFLGQAPAAMQFASIQGYYYLSLMLWMVVLGVTWLLGKSRLGLLMRAVRDDEVAASRCGIHTTKVKLVAFALSAGLSALGGTLYAQFHLFFEPATIMGITLSVQIVLMAVFGGMWWVLGPTVGSMVLVPLTQLLATYLGSRWAGIDLVAYGTILVLVIRYFPGGLLGLTLGGKVWQSSLGSAR